jgi:Peptidase_C39 like family
MSVRKSVVFGLISVVCWVAAGGVGYHAWQNLRAGSAGGPPRTAVVVHAPEPTPATPVEPTSTPVPTPLPTSLSIQGVPFTIQAPFQVWDKAHQEYCEAAAVYMVGQYWNNDHRQRIPPAEADAVMGRMVAWERATFPGVINLPLTDMVQVGQHFYPNLNLSAQVVPVDLGVIQQNLADRRPVIIPVMTHGAPGGRPIYPTYAAGSVYHALVLIGYDASRGIVYANDPGLREGLGLAYSWSTLQAALVAQAHTTVDADGVRVPFQQGTSMLIFQPQ